MYMKKKHVIHTSQGKKTVSRNSSTGNLVTPKTGKALKASVARKKVVAAKWDKTARAKLAEVRKKTSKQYSSVFKTLAQY
jgi:hypothetical protein